MLGSDGLYREWAYTALSRHRDEARFYLTVSPAFLNQVPEPLRTDDDVAGAIARMLDDSRAEHLAMDGVVPDTPAEMLGENLDRAQAELDDVEQRLVELQDDRDRTRWYQRTRRDEIDRILEGPGAPRATGVSASMSFGKNSPVDPRRPSRPISGALSASDLGLEPDLPAPAPDLAPDLGMDLGP